MLSSPDLAPTSEPKMPPLAHHLMLRLRDDRVIAPTTAARRTLAGVVLGLGREPGLLAFSGADTHVHLLVACDRAASGQLARRAEISLTRRLAPGVGFSTSFGRRSAMGSRRTPASTPAACRTCSVCGSRVRSWPPASGRCCRGSAGRSSWVGSAPISSSRPAPSTCCPTPRLQPSACPPWWVTPELPARPAAPPSSSWGGSCRPGSSRPCSAWASGRSSACGRRTQSAALVRAVDLQLRLRHAHACAVSGEEPIP